VADRRWAFGAISLNLLLLAAIFIARFPYLYMLLGALKNNAQLFRLPLTLLPSTPIVSNMATLFSAFPFARWYVNTILLASAQTALSVFLAALAGYTFAKHRFRFRNALFVLLLFTLMLPSQILLLPQFIEVVTFGWYNSYAAVIVPGAVDAYGIFLMRQYASSLPGELLDAARSDGASELALFWHVVLPLLGPAVAVLAILSFNSAWQAFLWPLIVLSDVRMFVLNVGLAGLIGPENYEYGVVLAGATLASLPVIGVFLFFQRQLGEAVATGAFKGG
jgi:multiple sugar transport system permease protein/arabinosaccharide transport system permease protein